MITFKFVRFTLVVCVSHTVNVLVTDIILNIKSQEHLILTLLHIGSRLFEGTCKETTRSAFKRHLRETSGEYLLHIVGVDKQTTA